MDITRRMREEGLQVPSWLGQPRWLPSEHELSADRAATARERILPSFVIVGAQKSGTSSLYQHLTRLPGVSPAVRKELDWFNNPRIPEDAALSGYRACFPLRTDGVISGEASPNYFEQPVSARRLLAAVPDVRVIISLRNPVDRAYSHYRMQVKRNWENRTFERALEESPRRLLDDDGWLTSDGAMYGYLLRGLYANQLGPWLDLIPPRNLCILRAEDYFADPAGTIRWLARFIGIGEVPDRRLPGPTMPHGSSTMDPETQSILADYFAPHNERLYRLLGRDFGWESG